ncbi:MAG: DUF429 domain-containing protein [Candidatus Berkelbacteria bacterium]|nr:DUF429 domain-containing protein [Candidatus Berkelbacteria bacterium]
MVTRLVIGIDLAGSEENRSGFCVIKEEFGQKETKSRSIFTNEEILTEIRRLHPSVIAIDAPLSTKYKNIPLTEDLKKYGALSLSLPGMQMLASRAEKLCKEIEKLGVPVIEILPKATQEIMGLEPDTLSKSKHQADAILAAITGFLYLENKVKTMGASERKITIPQPSRKKPLQ